MPMQSHLSQLERKHRALELEIHAESQRPGYDETKLAQLKRRKLTLKDQIYRIRTEMAPS